jgi:hypothetical protein
MYSGVADGAACAGPAATVHIERSHGTMYEFACHERNYTLPHILGGARAQERLAEEAVIEPPGCRGLRHAQMRAAARTEPPGISSAGRFSSASRDVGLLSWPVLSPPAPVLGLRSGLNGSHWCAGRTSFGGRSKCSLSWWPPIIRYRLALRFGRLDVRAGGAS